MIEGDFLNDFKRLDSKDRLLDEMEATASNVSLSSSKAACSDFSAYITDITLRANSEFDTCSLLIAQDNGSAADSSILGFFDNMK